MHSASSQIMFTKPTEEVLQDIANCQDELIDTLEKQQKDLTPAEISSAVEKINRIYNLHSQLFQESKLSERAYLDGLLFVIFCKVHPILAMQKFDESQTLIFGATAKIQLVQAEELLQKWWIAIDNNNNNQAENPDRFNVNFEYLVQLGSCLVTYYETYQTLRINFSNNIFTQKARQEVIKKHLASGSKQSLKEILSFNDNFLFYLKSDADAKKLLQNDTIRSLMVWKDFFAQKHLSESAIFTEQPEQLAILKSPSIAMLTLQKNHGSLSTLLMQEFEDPNSLYKPNEIFLIIKFLHDVFVQHAQWYEKYQQLLTSSIELYNTIMIRNSAENIEYLALELEEESQISATKEPRQVVDEMQTLKETLYAFFIEDKRILNTLSYAQNLKKLQITKENILQYERMIYDKYRNNKLTKTEFIDALLSLSFMCFHPYVSDLPINKKINLGMDAKRHLDEAQKQLGSLNTTNNNDSANENEIVHLIFGIQLGYAFCRYYEKFNELREKEIANCPDLRKLKPVSNDDCSLFYESYKKLKTHLAEQKNDKNVTDISQSAELGLSLALGINQVFSNFDVKKLDSIYSSFDPNRFHFIFLLSITENFIHFAKLVNLGILQKYRAKNLLMSASEINALNSLIAIYISQFNWIKKLSIDSSQENKPDYIRYLIRFTDSVPEFEKDFPVDEIRAKFAKLSKIDPKTVSDEAIKSSTCLTYATWVMSYNAQTNTTIYPEIFEDVEPLLDILNIWLLEYRKIEKSKEQEQVIKSKKKKKQTNLKNIAHNTSQLSITTGTIADPQNKPDETEMASTKETEENDDINNNNNLSARSSSPDHTTVVTEMSALSLDKVEVPVSKTNVRSLQDCGIDATEFSAYVPADVWQVATQIIKKGHQVYLVGGAVRDLLLHGVPHDFDLVTSASPIEVQCILNQILNAELEKVEIISKKKPMVKFSRINGLNNSLFEIEISSFYGGSSSFTHKDDWFPMGTTIEEDYLSRDFTINSIYINLTDLKIYDPSGLGLKDAKQQIIRTVNDAVKSFSEDPRRMLRALRFLVSNPSFKLHLDVEKALQISKAAFKTSQPEVILLELSKILLTPKRSAIINEILKYNFFKYLFSSSMSSEPEHKLGMLEAIFSHQEEHAIDSKERQRAVYLKILLVILLPSDKYLEKTKVKIKELLASAQNDNERLQIKIEYADKIRQLILKIYHSNSNYFDIKNLGLKDSFCSILEHLILKDDSTAILSSEEEVIHNAVKQGIRIYRNKRNKEHNNNQPPTALSFLKNSQNRNTAKEERTHLDASLSFLGNSQTKSKSTEENPEAATHISLKGSSK